MNRLTKGKALVGAVEAATLSVGGTAVTSTAAELNIVDGQCAGATFVVGAEAADAINVTVQLTDAAGADMAIRTALPWYIAADANGDTIGTAPSAGIAIGTDGLLLEWTANVSGLVVSEADGDIDITFSEAGALTIYLVLVLPTGKLAISDAITFAA